MDNKNSYNFFKMKQPIGDLFCALIPAAVIIEISASERRTAYNDQGIQRRLDRKRVKDIALFCERSDAMFPTPIVLSASSKYIKVNEASEKIEIDYNSILESKEYCGIVDGQHRLEGISESNSQEKFDLLVLFVFDIDVSTEAKLFSIINGNQRPISKSLIYDLARLSDMRTVEKVCSETVNYLNETKNSKLYHQIKMLGYKEYEDSLISQSALVTSLINLISKNVATDNLNIDQNKDLDHYSTSSEYILRPYFIKQEDEKIKKLVLNYLNAWIINLEEFDILESLIGKTIGFNATFKLFPKIFLNFREEEKIMSEMNFYDEINKILDIYILDISRKVEQNISEDGYYMNKDEYEVRRQKEIVKVISDYGSSQSGSNELAKDLIEIYNSL